MDLKFTHDKIEFFIKLIWKLRGEISLSGLSVPEFTVR
jgi:hypothetical protein